MIIWIIGMAGAGKTTIGKEVYKYYKQKESNWVLLDGDQIREIFLHDNELNSHTIQERYRNSLRLRSLCKMLDEQNINVVCCVLSIFPEIHAWNRKNFSQYFEIYIKVPFIELERRDQKGLYSGAKTGKIKNVVGFDIQFPEPIIPDLILHNAPLKNGNLPSPKDLAIQIIKITNK